MTPAVQHEARPEKGKLLAQAPQFLLAGPERTLYLEADPRAGDLVHPSGEDRELLAQEVRERFLNRQQGSRHLVGALPFDPRGPALLRSSARVRTFATVPIREPSRSASSQSQFPREEPESGGDHYVGLVERALVEVERGALKKVVLARARDLPCLDIDILALITRLRARHSSSHVFCMQLPDDERAGSRVLVGATPELLVSRQGRRVSSGPLAGTALRSSDSRRDAERREALLKSEKDRHEHRLVVEQIVRALEPLVREIAFDSEPHVIGTKSLWHLKTNITGTLRMESTTAFELALQLHPTPAVCGEPMSAALEFIRRHEELERGYFAGALGHMDERGDGEWYVTLRCAEIGMNMARVYAGAGIVSGSDPKSELAETAAKMATMLDLLEGR